jgi:hypothetical protein
MAWDRSGWSGICRRTHGAGMTCQDDLSAVQAISRLPVTERWCCGTAPGSTTTAAAPPARGDPGPLRPGCSAEDTGQVCLICRRAVEGDRPPASGASQRWNTTLRSSPRRSASTSGCRASAGNSSRNGSPRIQSCPGRERRPNGCPGCATLAGQHVSLVAGNKPRSPDGGTRLRPARCR